MAVNNTVLSTVQRLQRALSQVFAHDVSVVLFGSHARGDATPESDIDVLAMLPDLSPSSVSTALDIAWEIGYEADMVISLIPTMKDELGVMHASPLFQSIDYEGVPV